MIWLITFRRRPLVPLAEAKVSRGQGALPSVALPLGGIPQQKCPYYGCLPVGASRSRAAGTRSHPERVGSRKGRGRSPCGGSHQGDQHVWPVSEFRGAGERRALPVFPCITVPKRVRSHPGTRHSATNSPQSGASLDADVSSSPSSPHAFCDRYQDPFGLPTAEQCTTDVVGIAGPAGFRRAAPAGYKPPLDVQHHPRQVSARRQPSQSGRAARSRGTSGCRA